MKKSIREIQYFLNVKRTTAVASFSGDFTEESSGYFQRCLEELKNKDEIKFVIVNMQGVAFEDGAAIRYFAKFQSTLREDHEIFICSLEESLSKELDKAGVIRSFEVAPDLMSALQMIVGLSSKGNMR